VDAADLRRLVERFCAPLRTSGSPGEREAAELLAAELRERGAAARLEEESVHGTYWWPVGLTSAAGLMAARASSRWAALPAALATLLAADDISAAGGQRLRRRLPQRPTVNVVAEAGDPDGERTVVFVAHHDAAHSGLVFHPELARFTGRRFPKLHERQNTTPPTMWGAVAGPALATLAALTGRGRLRGAARALCAGYVAAMADIGLRATVPGANDNATGMATLVGIAEGIGQGAGGGARVLLVSTGSEESFMEGMRAFARRHFHELPPERTVFVCLDTLGSPHLLLLEAEGMLRLHEYPDELLRLVRETADELGVFLYPRLRFHNATDGVIALRAGYPTITFGSVDEFKIPTDYHWPSDTPERVNYARVADAVRLCLALLPKLPATPRSG